MPICYNTNNNAVVVGGGGGIAFLPPLMYCLVVASATELVKYFKFGSFYFYHV